MNFIITCSKLVKITDYKLFFLKIRTNVDGFWSWAVENPEPAQKTNPDRDRKHCTERPNKKLKGQKRAANI
jgi:hypothetical protein